MTSRGCIPQETPNYENFELYIGPTLKKVNPEEIYQQNIKDVAGAIVKILQFCGIHEYKAHTARDTIISAFQSYDEICQRIEFLPKRELRKGDLFHDLGSKCMMSLSEAQLTYSIMKRAFSAFYYGTAEFAIQDPVLDTQMIHKQECLWVHAAKRTAQIFAEYEGLFFSTQKKYEELIKRVYICLYERLRKRAAATNLNIFSCTRGNKKYQMTRSPKMIPKESIVIPISSDEYGVADQLAAGPGQTEARESQPQPRNFVNFPNCRKCHCPKLICDCEIDLMSRLLSYECGQGPFECRWFRVNDTEPPFDPCCPQLRDPVCPVEESTENTVESDLTAEQETEAVCEESKQTVYESENLEEQTANDNEITDNSTEMCEVREPDMEPLMFADKIICVLTSNVEKKNELRMKTYCGNDIFQSVQSRQRRLGSNGGGGGAIKSIKWKCQSNDRVYRPKSEDSVESPSSTNTVKQNGTQSKKKIPCKRSKKQAMKKKRCRDGDENIDIL